MELTGFATCPSCHTVHSRMANLADSTGDAWTCARCAQQWDPRRLAAVAAYAVWLAEHTAASAITH
jgi:hypothetical protein